MAKLYNSYSAHPTGVILRLVSFSKRELHVGGTGVRSPPSSDDGRGAVVCHRRSEFHSGKGVFSAARGGKTRLQKYYEMEISF